MTMDIPPHVNLPAPSSHPKDKMNQFAHIPSLDYRDIPSGFLDSNTNSDDLYGIQLFAINLRIIELNIDRKLAYLKKIKDTPS